jgi:hypothetical protein
MLHSDYRKLVPVTFPVYDGRQKYMHSFDAADPRMCAGLEMYHDVATTLLRAAGVSHGMVHMTVDEKIVQPGMSQRRPNPHVDGCFVPARNRWGGGGGWLHTCNDLGLDYPLRRMSIIVAASAPGCRAWRGEFDGMPADDGDLTHIADQLDAGEVLPANVGYLLSPDCVHESMVYEEPTQRQFVRIAFAVS